jgi:hypothetical protein
MITCYVFLTKVAMDATVPEFQLCRTKYEANVDNLQHTELM